MQKPKDAKLLIRPGDLINDFARRGWRGNKGCLQDITLECTILIRRGRPAERNHRFNARVEQAVQEPFDLLQLVAEQRRGRFVRQSRDKFVETEMKLLRKLHSVRARLVGYRG